MSRSADAKEPAGPSRHGRAAGSRRWPRLALAAAAIATLAVGTLAVGTFVVACASTGTVARHPARSAARAAATAKTHASPPVERLPIGTIGDYPVARHSLVLVDRSRAGAGRPRVLPTLVRYPVIPAAARAAGTLARGLFPLVVFAPGYLQCQGTYSSLLRAWASAGYVVAALDFPRTSCHASHPDEADLVNQPRDMAQAISALLAISARRHGPLASLVNPADIAVAGQSDGGDTVAAIAANTCCLDHKVEAAVVLAGAEWPPMPGTYFPSGTPPILFVQGDADTTNPPADSLMMYRADAAGPRFYLDLFGVGHLSPYMGHASPEPLVARTTTEFLDRYVAGQRSAAAAMRRAGNVTGIASLVRDGQLPP